VKEDDSDRIMSMLRDRITTLLRIEGFGYESGQREERMGDLLTLNRYGQDFRSNAHRVPVANQQ
jgi:hypothetical protein